MFHQSSGSRQNKSKMQVDVKDTIQTPRTHQVPSEINKGKSTWFQTCKGKEEIQNCSGKKKIFSLVRRESLTDSDFSSAPEVMENGGAGSQSYATNPFGLKVYPPSTHQ